MEQLKECKIIPLFKERKKEIFMTPQEFAKDYKIGINKAYQLVNYNGFPVIKNGNRYLIIRSQVEQWIINNIGLKF